MTPRDREALERILDCIEAIDAYVSRARRYRSRQPAPTFELRSARRWRPSDRLVL
jgi:hypothetical protein